jgi:hypothetical protein
MTATVIPFPIVRRHLFIQRQADHAVSMNPDASARYLEYQLEVQANSMRRKGIAEDLIAREVKCMETAIRVAFIRNSEQC